MHISHTIDRQVGVWGSYVSLHCFC